MTDNESPFGLLRLPALLFSDRRQAGNRPKPVITSFEFYPSQFCMVEEMGVL